MTQVKAPALSPTNLKFAEVVRNVHRVDVPPGIPVERVLEPDYWAHVAPRFGEWDRIECLAQDGAWYAELLVRKVAKELLGVVEIMRLDLNAAAKKAEPPTAAEFIVKFGGAHKWRVIRTSDNEVIHHGEPTELDARAWLENYLKQPA